MPMNRNSYLKIYGSQKTIASQPIAVFPFVSIENFSSKNESQYYKPEGTGFFIHKCGLFVTAKHVPYLNKKALKTFIAIHDHGSTVSVRHVKCFAIHPTADIAVGFLDKHDVRNKLIYDDTILYKHLVPSFDPLSMGDKVENFGYGNSSISELSGRLQKAQFNCQWSNGEITNLYPIGRDSSFLPGATVETNLSTFGHASGGPVFNANGEVIGVNSTSYDSKPPISYFTPIDTILELRLKHNFWRNMKIRNLFYKKGKLAV